MDSSIDGSGIEGQRHSEHRNYRKEESVEEHMTIAVDLAKAVFEIAVSKSPGRVCLRKRLTISRSVGTIPRVDKAPKFSHGLCRHPLFVTESISL
jgi:hypothetical protein